MSGVWEHPSKVGERTEAAFEHWRIKTTVVLTSFALLRTLGGYWQFLIKLNWQLLAGTLVSV